jgi:hypothetical protein
MPQCLFPGCQNAADNEIGVRLRYPPEKKAVWAPDTHAYLCDAHARQGVRITVTLEATNDGKIETLVRGVVGGLLMAVTGFVALLAGRLREREVEAERRFIQLQTQDKLSTKEHVSAHVTRQR